MFLKTTTKKNKTATVKKGKTNKQTKKERRDNVILVKVWERLTSPSNYTGIHKHINLQKKARKRERKRERKNLRL